MTTQPRAKDDALTELDAAHAAFVSAYDDIPDDALSWLRPGDDYAIGGIVIHLIQSLDGYIGTLEAMRAAGFADTESPGEDEATVDEQLGHARRGLTPSERLALFSEMAAKRSRLRAVAAGADDEEFARVIAVTYPGDEVPYPTSAALVLQWMSEHLREHVPHVRQLFAEWKANSR